MVREMDFVDECYADKDLSLLKKLTLVIPTYNRNYYLSRCLWYHAHFPFGQIIVADSSPEEKKVVNRETVAKVREMFGADILYLEYEPETEKYGGDIYRKWGDAVMHVETEYSQICTDKEFLIISYIIEYIAYLNEDNEHIAVFAPRADLLVGSNDIVSQSYIFSQRDIGPSFNGENNSSITRFLDPFYYPQLGSKTVMFALYRTNIHKMIYENYINSSILDIRHGELFVGYIGYIFGKIHHFVNSTHRLRDELAINLERKKNSEYYCNSSESSNSRYPTLENILINNKTSNFHGEFINTVAKTLSDSNGNLTQEDVNKFASMLHESPMFSTNTFSLSLKRRLVSFYYRYPLLQTLWIKVPTQIKKSLNWVVRIVLKNPLPIESQIVLNEEYSERGVILSIIVNYGDEWCENVLKTS